MARPSRLSRESRHRSRPFSTLTALVSLNLYVMPLCRFLAGDFDTPLARMGIPFKRVTPAGVFDPPKAGSASADDIALGRRKAVNIIEKVGESNRVTVAWPDRGDAVYTAQAHGMDGLRAYATWLDYGDKLPDFQLREYDRHPVWRLHKNLHRPATFPHLAQHGLSHGYFLPCDFVKPVIVQTLRIGSFSLPVHACSAVRLAAELEAINDLLRVPDPFPHAEWANHPYYSIFTAFDQLRTVARLSREHRLPIIFEG